MSLDYLVKYLCSKIAMLKKEFKQTAMWDIATQNTVLKYLSGEVSII